MPTISMFYGIRIMMYEGDREHNPPHFHAKYAEFEASFTFDGELLSGKLPRKQLKMVSAWAVIHYDELLANWSLLENKEGIYKIEPLK